MDNWLKTKDLPTHFVAACGLVYKEGKVLLVRSVKRGWEMPGGVIERGETVLDGLVREIHEESGILCRPTKFVGFYQNLKEKQGYGPLEGMTLPTVANFSFLCEYVSGEPMGASAGIASDETLEAGWFTEEEALKMVTYPSYDTRLKDMIQSKDQDHVVFNSYSLGRDGDIEYPGERTLL